LASVRKLSLTIEERESLGQGLEMRPNPAIAGRKCGSVADSLAKELPQNRRMQRGCCGRIRIFHG